MPRTVYIETFGCQMNELDSELVAGRLSALGYRITGKAEGADVVLYNTCSVREHAEQKVWSRLGEMKARKKSEPSLVVGVLGCLAERDGVDLIRRMPVVDILCGPGELDKLPALLDNAVRTRENLAADEERESEGARDPDRDATIQRYSDTSERGRARLISAGQVALQGNSSRRSATLAAAEDSLELLDLSRSISPYDDHGPKRSAYVRITRGCNKFCTYCVVPFTRGAEVHRPPDHIVDECKRLADAGVVEVTLLGQTVNHYRFEHGAAVSVHGLVQPQKGRSYAGGHSRDPFAGANTTTFSDLLARIHDEVPAIARLRFVTSYPRDFGDDVLEVMRDHPRICRYLHVPGQSGSDRILKLMNRGYTAGEYLEFLGRARAHLHQPEIGRPLMISGDFIVGFPTETDEDFEASCGLLRKARYKNAFIFKYSPRPGTTAFDRLADDVPDAVKRARNNRMLAIQAGISEELGRELVGTVVEAFVEGLSPRERKRRKKAPHSHSGTVALTINGAGAGEQEACCGTGTVVEDAEPGEAAQLRARTDGDQIVLFDAPGGMRGESLVGRFVRVRLESAVGLSLFGSAV
jgi:tRNA-2-methylthio-N6-dimethylallyladenosine synthase